MQYQINNDNRVYYLKHELYNTNDINKITNTLINYITNYKHATDAATFLRVRSGYEICRCGELDAETHFEMPRIAEANTQL